MGRKNRSHNNNVKRERFAVKELVRLKKCLGLDQTVKDLMEKVSDISTLTDAKSIKQVSAESARKLHRSPITATKTIEHNLTLVSSVHVRLQKAKDADNKAVDTEMEGSDDDESGGPLKDLVVKNEKTGVTHIYDAKTKRDQFGNFPVWYNRNAEKKKKRIRNKANPKRGKKLMSLFNVANRKDYKF